MHQEQDFITTLGRGLNVLHQEQDFITPEELKKCFRMGTNNVYKLIHSEGFPAIRVSPKRIIIPKAALEKWVSEHMYQNKEDNV